MLVRYSLMEGFLAGEVMTMDSSEFEIPLPITSRL